MTMKQKRLVVCVVCKVSMTLHRAIMLEPAQTHE